jgi:hypothetical protein
MISDQRRFLYQRGVDTARIFEIGETIPEGWTDLPDSDEWDNPPEGYEKPEPKPKKIKYPSQMNKDELIEFGSDLGIEFKQNASNKDMRDAINSKMKEDHENDD